VRVPRPMFVASPAGTHAVRPSTKAPDQDQISFLVGNIFPEVRAQV